MAIVLTRIDDRLIHGQVVEGWLKNIRITHVVVVSDEVARDKTQQVLLSMAIPTGIRASTYSIDEAARKIDEGLFERDRALLLLSRPQDVVRLLDRGVKLVSVNVGGMHYSPGKRQLLRNLCVDKSDIAALCEIGRRGVELEGRVLPSDERINVSEVVYRETVQCPEEKE